MQVNEALSISAECNPGCLPTQFCRLGSCQCLYGQLSSGACLTSNATLCNQCDASNFGTCILGSSLTTKTCVCHNGWQGASFAA